MSFQSLRELQSFVRSLDVPEERREVVEAELLDHFFARLSDGATEAEALAAFGAEGALRIRFEPVERGFGLTRAQAARGGAALGLAVFAAASVLIFGREVFWTVLEACGLLRVHTPAFVSAAADFAVAFGTATALVLRVALTVLAIRLFAPRRRAVTLREEPGASALELVVLSAITLASPLLLEPTLANVLEPVFPVRLGSMADDAMIGIAIWFALTAHGLFSAIGRFFGRRRSLG